MHRFACPTCRHELHFHNYECLGCGGTVAYDPGREAFAVLTGGTTEDDRPACANRAAAGCNWLVSNSAGGFCLACRHNRTVPDTTVPGNAANWARIELAKRHLFYSLLKWQLPHPTRDAAPNGLAFDFLADTTGPDGRIESVMTGHASGLITLNIAEGCDAEREARRTAMGEPYRTLIGHMRHEIGHYYWEVLVRDGRRLDGFRDLFGDERRDYAEALKAHYACGSPSGWEAQHISAYAAAHPWEDFAETWAHYIHIVDASDTAHAFGMSLRPLDREGRAGATVDLDANPYLATDLAEVLADWMPLTVAMNAINRAMGQPDLYPFVLNEAVRRKLAFIHDLIRAPRHAV